MKSGLEIAQEAVLRPITDVAADAGILEEELEQYGRFKGKIACSILERLADRPDGKLVITTAITPTKAGEGKTTTSISLAQGMGKIGKDVMLCLREPSMGPVFGIKGGGNGGGYAQVVPMEEINLHFNGDFHAVRPPTTCSPPRWTRRSTTATRSASTRQSVTWPRTLDVNDRELRYGVVGLGGRRTASRARTSSSSWRPRRSWPCSRSRATSRTSARGSAASSSPRPTTASRSPPTTCGSPARWRWS